MKAFFLDFNRDCKVPLYIQLYRKLKEEITSGTIPTGEKLPSIRHMARNLDVSVTTVKEAYNQLLVEGYVSSRPHSGFYVLKIPELVKGKGKTKVYNTDFSQFSFEPAKHLSDLSSFDFKKWKKCMTRIFNDYPEQLLLAGDVQGEPVLRHEISKYLFSSRGVEADPEKIVIAAGMQQLTQYISQILKKMDIDYLSTESPGYAPIKNIFRDHGFTIGEIPVTKDGIRLDLLPKNVPSAVYVNPSNQFPTGAVMPIGNRYQLLDWAEDNRSIILEDDYDSELRYFGNPVPALQGLVKNSRVVYLGSFSSTLFPAIRISYMVLPEEMAKIFQTIKDDYTQTCSKTEQLTLALFMEDGHYYTNIKKLRKLYSRKLQILMDAFAKYGDSSVIPEYTKSGLNMLISVKTKKTATLLCREAESLGIRMEPAEIDTVPGLVPLIIYYNQIPLEKIDELVKQLVSVII